MKAKHYKVVDKDGNLISNISCTEIVKNKIKASMEDYDVIPADEEDPEKKNDDR